MPDTDKQIIKPPVSRQERFQYLKQHELDKQQNKMLLAEQQVPDTAELIQELSNALEAAMYVMATDMDSAGATAFYDRCQHKHGITPGLADRASVWLKANDSSSKSNQSKRKKNHA